MISVLVKASSSIARAGLESLLRAHPAFHLVPQPRDSSGGHPADEPALESHPDVLLVEAETLADSMAREAMDFAEAGGPAILLLRNPATEPVAEALRAGVKAVLPSGLSGQEIVAAVEAVSLGLVVLHGTDVEMLLRAPSAVSSGGSEALIEPLTAREVEVLRLLSAGLGNKEIASRLEISEHTVKFHVSSIMGKLGAASRTEAVTLGIRHGLIMI